LAAALGLGVLLPGGVLAADTVEISARVLGGGSDGSRWRFLGVGVELPLQGGMSWTARGGAVSYTYMPTSYVLTVSDYQEDGSGTFWGVGWRFYPGAESKGWYFGVNLDYISVGVDWVTSYAHPVPSDDHGHGDIVGFVPGASLGYKTIFDNGIAFEADLYIGWLSAVDTDEVPNATGFPFPGYLGLALGKQF